MKKNWICKLFGHKISEYTDSGFQFCTRCKAHEYYDSSEFESDKWKDAGLLFIPFYWINTKIVELRFKNTQNKLPF